MNVNIIILVNETLDIRFDITYGGKKFRFVWETNAESLSCEAFIRELNIHVPLPEGNICYLLIMKIHLFFLPDPNIVWKPSTPSEKTFTIVRRL